MANYFARKTGNVNATDVWATTPAGTAAAVTFASGDVLYANSFTITVNVDTNLGTTGEVRNDNTNSATAGGGFNLNNGVTLTANVYAGSVAVSCVTFSGSSGSSATINGSIFGGSVTNAAGVTTSSSGTLTITGNATGGTNAAALVNSGTASTLNVTGNITGGAGNGAGLSVTNSGICNVTGNVSGGSVNNSSGLTNGTGTITIIGNVTGGSGNALGVTQSSSGSVTITGTVIGGTSSNGIGANNGSSGTITINGTAIGGTSVVGANNGGAGTMTVTRAKGNGFGIGSAGLTSQPGVSGAQASFTYVKEFEYGDLGQSPTSGNIMLTDSTSNVMLLYRYGSTKKTLTEPGATVDYPANSNVRSGTVFGFGSRTGTLAVPAASSVAAGVAVDNTVGTAVLTQANVWSYALSSASATSGSVGEKLKKVANTSDIIALG